MEVVLQPDEQLAKEETFTSSLLLVWLKTNFKLTNKRVTGTHPNTLFGVIPLGQQQFTYPLKNIASVAASTKFYFWRLILGLVLLYAGISIITSSFIPALVLLLLALNLLFHSYTATFIVTNNAGQAPIIELSILEKDKVSQLVSSINHQIAAL